MIHDPDLLQQIAIEVEQESHMDPLLSGLYFDFAKEVAKRYCEKQNPLFAEKNKSVVESLADDQKHYITFIAMFTRELVKDQIITPAQRLQIERFIFLKKY